MHMRWQIFSGNFAYIESVPIEHTQAGQIWSIDIPSPSHDWSIPEWRKPIRGMLKIFTQRIATFLTAFDVCKLRKS